MRAFQSNSLQAWLIHYKTNCKLKVSKKCLKISSCYKGISKSWYVQVRDSDRDWHLSFKYYLDHIIFIIWKPLETNETALQLTRYQSIQTRSRKSDTTDKTSKFWHNKISLGSDRFTIVFSFLKWYEEEHEWQNSKQSCRDTTYRAIYSSSFWKYIMLQYFWRKFATSASAVQCSRQDKKIQQHLEIMLTANWFGIRVRTRKRKRERWALTRCGNEQIWEQIYWRTEN